ncbi:hypothetical protein LTR62_003837 [Meristemomyces frigidus]|uniref:Indole-diterpene biosynthesis protein PaxU n=1 Tax=Meristemomyces frigidus TaxID=1508187 RepID=A0AAN7YPF2_9PEZI|nr:hypothetical protein LTR62_003837 [Meristemomyces frigidus]
MAAHPSKLNDLTILTDTISLYTPPQTTTTTSPHHHDSQSTTSTEGPKLIILCAWFRARPKHIGKYTTTYRIKFPLARILVLDTQQRRLGPAIEVLQSAVVQKGEADFRGKVVLHAFSNGGSNTAVQLASAWHQLTETPLPLMGMVLDSCPGSDSLSLAAHAILLSFPRKHGWWVAVMVYFVVLPMMIAPKLLLGRRNVIEVLRAGLNDPALFAVERVARTYIYSKADLLVPFQVVEEHVAEAREKRYEVSSVGFEGSAHVAHVNDDGERYWYAVEEVVSGYGKKRVVGQK